MKVQQPSFTAEVLRAEMLYDPETGEFWQDGKRIDRLRKNGYVYVSCLGKKHRANRLAWYYVHGVWPQNEIDHRDQNKANNKLENLREATRGFNQENRTKAHKHNKLGILGVSETRSGTYTAAISIQKRHCHLGTFPTPQEAHAAYLGAKRAFHLGCTI